MDPVRRLAAGRLVGRNPVAGGHDQEVAEEVNSTCEWQPRDWFLLAGD